LSSLAASQCSWLNIAVRSTRSCCNQSKSGFSLVLCYSREIWLDLFAPNTKALMSLTDCYLIPCSRKKRNYWSAKKWLLVFENEGFHLVDVKNRFKSSKTCDDYLNNRINSAFNSRSFPYKMGSFVKCFDYGVVLTLQYQCFAWLCVRFLHLVIARIYYSQRYVKFSIDTYEIYIDTVFMLQGGETKRLRC